MRSRIGSHGALAHLHCIAASRLPRRATVGAAACRAGGGRAKPSRRSPPPSLACRRSELSSSVSCNEPHFEMPRIARLGDYKGGGGGGGGAGGGDSGSDEDGQPAFIGNGQNVIGPPKAKTVDDVFKQKGVDGAGGKKQSCKIVFWKSGYTINFNEPGGESDLFPYETPEGKAFVEQVAMGRLPKQLEEMMKAKGLTDGRRAVELDIAVEDKRQGTDDYVKPPYRAFSGAAASVGQAAPPPAAAVFKAATGAGAASAIVDPSAPKTSVQVKLVDGKRIIVELNLTHKVSDLVARVAAAAATGGKPFTLMTGFPPKALDNPGLTIEEAGLKNASVQQHA